jgi:hypothetical protein
MLYFPSLESTGVPKSRPQARADLAPTRKLFSESYFEIATFFDRLAIG